MYQKTKSMGTETEKSKTYRFGITWGWVNYDWNVILVWTKPSFFFNKPVELFPFGLCHLHFSLTVCRYHGFGHEAWRDGRGAVHPPSWPLCCPAFWPSAPLQRFGLVTGSPHLLLHRQPVVHGGGLWLWHQDWRAVWVCLALHWTVVLM